MKSNIQLSVIIPTRNIPLLLARCVNSIPQRDDIEIIVVDDNSYNAEEIYKSTGVLERSDVTMIFTKEGKGAGYARNVGIEKAKGEWVVFSDSDDFFTADLLPAFDNYKDTDYEVVVFPIRVVNSETLEEGPWRYAGFNKQIARTDISYKDKLLSTSVLWTRFIRKTILDTYHIRCEEIKCSNDQMFSTLLALNAKKVFFDCDFYIYTLTYRAGSLTKVRDKESFECRLGAEERYNDVMRKYGEQPRHDSLQKFMIWAADFDFATMASTYKKLKYERGNHAGKLKYHRYIVLLLSIKEMIVKKLLKRR